MQLKRTIGRAAGRVASLVGAVALAVTMAAPVPALAAWSGDEIVSGSKTATQLDENYESQVTLSLPSAQKQLGTDVVFVLDKSTSAALEDQALAMLANLKEQAGKTSANVKVGVVIFNSVANVTDFKDLSTEYDAIETAIRTTHSSGTNTDAGLKAGKAMLDNDTSVSADHKYLIFVSDGITYMYGDEPTVTAWSFMGDSLLTWAGPDNWSSKYGSNEAPAEGWSSWLNTIGAQVEVQGTQYEYPYGGTPTETTPVEDQSTYANSIDKALYLTYQDYQAAADAGYHVYAMTAQSEAGNTHKWGPSFMNYLAGGQSVSFDQIENDILYMVDFGSTVTDYMGYVEGDYDFDFVNDASKLTMNVNGEVLTAKQEGENLYGFGEWIDGTYEYVLHYYPGEGGAEHFVWTINAPVSNLAHTQLTYSVKLANPKTTPGTYGVYDEDGSQGFEGLYTNNSATLDYVTSNGETGEMTFAKPTVSYTVAEPEQPVVPVEPTTPEQPAAPEQPTQPETKPAKKVAKGGVPKTGDASASAALLGGAAIVAAAAVAGGVALKKSK